MPRSICNEKTKLERDHCLDSFQLLRTPSFIILIANRRELFSFILPNFSRKVNEKKIIRNHYHNWFGNVYDFKWKYVCRLRVHLKFKLYSIGKLATKKLWASIDRFKQNNEISLRPLNLMTCSPMTTMSLKRISSVGIWIWNLSLKSWILFIFLQSRRTLKMFTLVHQRQKNSSSYAINVDCQ